MSQFNNDPETAESVRLFCMDCGHVWAADFGLPIELGEFVKRIRKIRCKCGAKDSRIAIGDPPPKARKARQK